MWAVTRLIRDHVPGSRRGFCRLRNTGTFCSHTYPCHEESASRQVQALYLSIFIWIFLRSAFAVFSSFSEIDTAQRSYRVGLSIELCIENPTAHTKVQSHSIKSENGPRSEKENRAAWAVNCGPFAGPMKADIVRVSLDPCYSVPADPNHFWVPYGAASSFRAYPDSCTVARICLH